MNKLPKIYKNEIRKKINNNKEMCYVEEKKGLIQDKKQIEDTLKNVFAGLGKPYNTKVIIKTKDNEYDTSLISKNKEEVITLENKIIKINEIEEITIKK